MDPNRVHSYGPQGERRQKALLWSKGSKESSLSKKSFEKVISKVRFVCQIFSTDSYLSGCINLHFSDFRDRQLFRYFL